MALYRVEAPDGEIIKLEGPENASQDDIIRQAQRLYTPKEIKPDTGFTGAMKASAQQIQADFERLKGRTGFKDVNLAEQEAKAYEKKAGQVFKPTEESWTEAPLQKLKETVGGSLPYMAAPLAAGAAALTLPASLPTAAIATGLGGIASATQFTGSNLSRQQQEDPTLKLQDTKLGYAALASIPQAAFDMVGFRFIPGIQRIFKSAGKEISEKAAKDMIDQGIFRTVGQYVAGGAKISGIEGATEAGQQVFERLQAGLNIADEQARSEYFDSFIGGAALGAIASPFGVRGQRGQAKEVLAKAETKRADELAAEQQATQAAKDEMAAIVKEQKPIPIAPEQIAQMQQEVISQRGTLQREMDRFRAEAVKETDPDKLAAISDRAAQIQTGLNDLDADKVKEQIGALSKEAGILKKQVKVAEKKTPETVDELKTQLEKAQIRLQDLKDKLPALAIPEQEGAGQNYKNQMAAKLAALTKARDEGDLEAVGKLARQYKEMQGKYQGVQSSLFEETKTGMVYPEADKAAADKIRADLAAEKEATFQKALGTVEEATTPKATEVVQPATEEDIAAQKEQQAKLKELQDSRSTMQKLFDTANNSNDIEAAIQLRKLIEAKDKEIEAAKVIPKTTETEKSKYQGDRTREEDINAIKAYQEQIKKADDTVKATNPDKMYDAEGNLTKYGETAVTAQNERDRLQGLLKETQERLDRANIAAGTEQKTTEQVAQAFPEKGGPDVEVMGKLNTLRKRVGDTVTARAAIMGLRRKLHQARVAKNREGASDAILKMRDLVEQTTEQAKDNEIPIPKELPENSKKYYRALNAVRAKQDKALEVYMDSVEALVNRDYIGGVTKKAKVTKSILEKRIENNAKLFASAMLEEVAVHRRVAGAVELTQEQKNTTTKKYAEAIEEFKRLASGELAAPEAARSVIAEHIGDITYTAINEGMKGRFVGKTERAEPLLKLQFGKPEPEEVGTLAKDMGLTVREKEEGKKLDVSNVGNIEQKELFAEKELKPIATKRATHGNFMRFVGLQAGRLKQAKENAQQAINATQKVTKSLEERISSYRKIISNYKNTLANVLANVKEDARQRAKAEVRSQAAKLRKEALALSEELYGEQLQTLENSLATLKNERAFFAKSVKKMADSQFKHAVNSKIHSMDAQIKTVHNNIVAIHESFEAAVENAPVDLEEKLYKEYVGSDPVLKSVVAAMKRKRDTFDKMVAEHNNTLEAEGRARRVEEAASEEPVKQITPEERAQEQRLLAGLNLPGMRLTGNLVDAKATLANLKVKLKQYIDEGKKAQVTKTRVAIEEQQKIVNETRQPIFTPEEKAEKQSEATAAQVRKDIQHSRERAELKKKQIEMRRKEGIELAQKKRNSMETNLAEAKERLANAENNEILPTKAELDILKGAIAKAEKDLKNLKAIPTEERIPPSARAQGPATRKVHPTKMFAVGTANKPVTKGVATASIEKGIKEGAKAFDFNMGVERELSGLSANEFGDLFNSIDKNNVDYRIDTAITGTGLTQDATQAVVDKVKLPKGLKLTVLSKLTPSLQAAIKNNGYDPATVKGGVLPDGSVFIVAENHADVKDVQRTIAHEVTGHLGVENLIGEAGMDALAKRVAKQEGGVMGLAEKLGVQEEALGAYMSAKQSGKSDEFAAAKALREVIAHTEEARVDKNFLGKANEFIKALVGAVRAALRKMGLDLDLSTSDVYKMLRDARKEFDAVAPGMYKGRDGEIQVRSGGAKYGPGGVVVADAADKILTQKQKQKILPANFGLLFEQRVVSATAGLMRAFENKGMKNSIEALQTKYYIANHNQRFVWASHALTSGVPVLEPVKRSDGKTEYVLKQSKGANIQGIIDALSKAKWGNAQGVNNVWSLHRILLRAESVGFDKLNFDKAEVTEKLLRANEAVINSNPSLKAAIKEADGIYNQYNRDLLTRFLVSTGAMSKEKADALVKDNAYIPYYRKKADGTVVLDFGEGVKNVRIGNIKDQPYLNELVGGDERIVDAFTGILQNTNLLIDMGLRNLATRQTAFALDSMGLLEKGKNKEGSEKRTGIRKGPGPASDKVIRFYANGDQVHAVVDTEAVGVPSELVVEGLGGVSTSVPTIVKMMGIPASILRTFITRNPVYALRQAARDPLNAVMTNGIELKAMGNSYKILGKALTGNKEAVSDVFKYGITGSNVYTGTVEDMQKQMMRMLDGKNGIDNFYAKLDTLAVNADSATRQAAFTNFRKQGMTEMEAMLATYELMPFTQRGTSASVFWLSTMVPFLNAQIQGLNVLWKAMSGKATFQEKLKVKQQFYAKGAMMFGMSIAYAAMMSDDEAYKNANDDERYNNWFVYTPFSKEPFKVPIPFELGILFKAIPEAMVNVAKGDREAGEAINAIRKLIQSNSPIGLSSLPQAIKPIIEVTADYSFYTGRSIVGERLKGVDPSERYNANTNEILKLIGKGTGSIPVLGEYLSPVQLEYLIRGYFGSLPLALASITNPAFSTGEAPEGRGLVSSTTPVIGSLFQPLDANGMINRAYKDMESIQRTKATYNKLVEDGNEKGISKLLDAEADKLNLAPLAGAFRSRMGNLAKEERRIRSDPNMSAAEKRELLDMIKEEKIGLSKELISARE